MIKKLSIKALRETIKRITEEEIALFLKEQEQFDIPKVEFPAETQSVPSGVNKSFDKIEDKDKFIEWIMRYYFNPAKNSNKPWWPRGQEVTPENVLQFLSKPDNNFPLSPKELVDDWFIKKSLGKSMAGMKTADLGDEPESESGEEEKSGTKYHTGATTLKSIGKDIGMTGSHVQNLEKSGLEKINKLLGGEGLASLEDDDSADRFLELFKKIDEVRDEMSHVFAQEIKNSGGDVGKFVASIREKHLVSPADVESLAKAETDMLAFLADKGEEEIAEYLRGDAEKDNNRIKTFQAAVAHKVSPGARRGRPRKVTEPDLKLVK